MIMAGRRSDPHRQTVRRLLVGRQGRFFFTMMAAFAGLERDIIHERTMAGLAAAKAQGRNGGRPAVMTRTKLAAAKAPFSRREPYGDRQGTRRQPRIGVSSPSR